MKIRIHRNSIRYRLSKTDIAEFSKVGVIEEKTDFINGRVFSYRLEKRADLINLEASFSGNQICIFVPEKLASEWTSSEVTGYESKTNIGKGKELLLLIEKDFACLDHTLEDQSDNYPNPKTVC